MSSLYFFFQACKTNKQTNLIWFHQICNLQTLINALKKHFITQGSLQKKTDFRFGLRFFYAYLILELRCRKMNDEENALVSAPPPSVVNHAHEKRAMLLITFLTIILSIGLFPAVVHQMTATKKMQTSLEMEDVCSLNQAVCLSNVRDLLQCSRNSYWTGISALIFIGFGLCSQWMLICTLIIAKKQEILDVGSVVVALVVTCVFNAVSFICIIVENGNLWAAILQYSAQLPTYVVNDVHAAAQAGIASLVLSCMNGCPCAVTMVILLIIAR